MYTLWPGCRDILKAYRPSELCVDYQKDTEDKARKRKEWPPAVYVTTVSKMFFTVVTVWYPSSIKDGLTDRKIEKRIDTNPKAILFRPLFVIQKLLWRAVRPVVQKRWGFFFVRFSSFLIIFAGCLYTKPAKICFFLIHGWTRHHGQHNHKDAPQGWIYPLQKKLSRPKSTTTRGDVASLELATLRWSFFQPYHDMAISCLTIKRNH